MPEIEDLLATDFDNVDTIVQRGYKAALPYRDLFRELADSLTNMVYRIRSKIFLISNIILSTG